MAVFFCAVAGIFFMDTLDMVKAANELPRLLMILVLALSVGMVFESYKKSKQEALEAKAVGESPSNAAAKSKSDAQDFMRLALFVVLIAAYVLLLKPVGYFIVTPLFIVVAFVLLKATSLLISILTGLGFSVFIYFLFVVFLHLPVPMGILSGILG